MKNIGSLVVAGLAGLLFGLGLFVSQMTNPEKVLSFLDLSRIPQGQWDPSLAFVMVGGLLVMGLAHFIRKGMSKPQFTERFHLPDTSKIDRPLILGAVLFGLGWGLIGFCPGPALASLAFFEAESFIFLAGMLLGLRVAGFLKKA